MAIEDFPAQCRQICPATSLNIELYATKNCPGPNPFPGDINTRIHIQNNEVIKVEEEVIAGPEIGKVACRNVGINASLDKLVDNYQQGNT